MCRICCVHRSEKRRGNMDITYTNRVNPTTCNNEIGNSNFSQPSPRLTIQILNVRHVSVRLLAVALTCLVTLSPKKLNSAMLIAIAIPEYKTAGLSIIWCHPLGRSKNVDLEEIAGMERIGTKRRMEITPKRPS